MIYLLITEYKVLYGCQEAIMAVSYDRLWKLLIDRKISKADFERLKESALKAYTQHNLYATVSKQLENLKQEREYYKSQLEESRRCRAEDYNDFRYELKSLEKENTRLSLEINKVNEILRSMSKEFQIEFFKVEKEIEIEKENKEKEKNKSYGMRL